MKKGKKIVPQHIPNGQNYTEDSLRELNSELSKFAYLALILYLGSEIGLFNGVPERMIYSLENWKKKKQI